MNTTLLLLAILASPPTIEPQAACEAASMVMRDMRYVEGKTAAPGDFSHPKIQARIASCVEIAALAAPHGDQVVFASIAIAYNESNFRKGVAGKAGEEGRMQVMFKHHCKNAKDLNDGNGHCTNPERAGVRAVRLMLPKHGLWGTLKRYNGSGKYASKVEGFTKAIERSYTRQNTLAQADMR